MKKHVFCGSRNGAWKIQAQLSPHTEKKRKHETVKSYNWSDIFPSSLSCSPSEQELPFREEVPQ